MELLKMSKIELLTRCNELNIIKYKSKNKRELIQLIQNEILSNSKSVSETVVDAPEKLKVVQIKHALAIQRIVNDKLGKNIMKDHIKIYEEIEKKIGQHKKCNFGHTRGSKTGIKHDGDCNVSIHNFELRGVSYNENTDEIIFTKGSDGLQGFCRDCSKRRRKARIENERKQKKDKTIDEIYDMYTKKYGINTKKCSRCCLDKHLYDYSLSIGMECGIHNMCKKCSYEYGSSIGDRWLIYLPDGTYKYNKKDIDMHDDHIFPLSLGGSNEEINHQIITSVENLSKSNSIDSFTDINSINPKMLSSRFRYVLHDSIWSSIQDLKIHLSKSIYDDILQRSKLNDAELLIIYKSYCEKYNLRKNINRAVKKFREFCEMRNIV